MLDDNIMLDDNVILTVFAPSNVPFSNNASVKSIVLTNKDKSLFEMLNAPFLNFNQSNSKLIFVCKLANAFYFTVTFSLLFKINLIKPNFNCLFTGKAFAGISLASKLIDKLSFLAKFTKLTKFEKLKQVKHQKFAIV